MDSSDLPSEFDVVILGTGLPESVVAAACSRVGQRVLHLDRRDYYAANWASFTFNSLLSWIQQQDEESQPEDAQDWSHLLEEGEEIIQLTNVNSDSSITNLQVFSYTSELDEEDPSVNLPTAAEEEDNGDGDGSPNAEPPEINEAEAPGGEEEQLKEVKEEPEAAMATASDEPNPSEPKKISYKELLKEGRRFNIDLVSKLLFSKGSLVDLLIKSNVSRYAEFKNVSRILSYRLGNLEQVPCNRADVFANRQLSVVEKRKLMRFLTSCVVETEDQRAYSARPYSEFLRAQAVGDNLQHHLLYAIAMVTEDTPTEEALASTRHFLHSLGRYGNTPFLFPIYGLGEIPQCFCRMCAVFGGIYCLRQSVHCIIVDQQTNRCKAVIDTRGQRISCKHLVMEDSYISGAMKKEDTPSRLLSRAVLITNSSILPGDGDQQVSLITVPPEPTGHPSVKIVELSSSTMTCMPGTYLVHLTCQSVGSAHEDLSPLVTRMFNTGGTQDQDSRPSVLWCFYFNMADGSAHKPEDHDVPSNVYICFGPDGSLGHDHAIEQAESIFQRILPEEEFCPPAPNPEDIIYDGDNCSSTAEQEDPDLQRSQPDQEPNADQEPVADQEQGADLGQGAEQGAASSYQGASSSQNLHGNEVYPKDQDLRRGQDLHTDQDLWRDQDLQREKNFPKDQDHRRDQDHRMDQGLRRDLDLRMEGDHWVTQHPHVGAQLQGTQELLLDQDFPFDQDLRGDQDYRRERNHQDDQDFGKDQDLRRD